LCHPPFEKHLKVAFVIKGPPSSLHTDTPNRPKTKTLGGSECESIPKRDSQIEDAEILDRLRVPPIREGNRGTGDEGAQEPGDMGPLGR
jgi:hypothetical protein